MAENLPPLPSPHMTDWSSEEPIYFFAEHQMRAYAAEAVKAEREACPKLAMTATETGNKYPMTASEQLRLDIAAAIRARKDNHG
jgi:hypothetical protein